MLFEEDYKEYKEELEEYDNWDFTGDLKIATYFGEDAIIDTCKRSWKMNKDNFVVLTKLIMNMNHFTWFLNSIGRDSEKLIDLYYEYYDKYFELFKDNKRATQFFIKVTD